MPLYKVFGAEAMNESIRQSTRFSRGFEIKYDEELNCFHEVEGLEAEAHGILLDSRRNSEYNLNEEPAVCKEDLDPVDLEAQFRSPATTSVEVDVSVEGGLSVETFKSDYDTTLDTLSENTLNRDSSLTMDDIQKNKNVIVKFKEKDGTSAQDMKTPIVTEFFHLSKNSHDRASQNIVERVEMKAISPTPQARSSSIVEQNNWVPQVEEIADNINLPIEVPSPANATVYAVANFGLVLSKPNPQAVQVKIKSGQSASDFDSNASTEVKIGSENKEILSLSDEASTQVDGLQSSVKTKNKVTTLDGSKEIDSLKDISHSDDSSFLNTRMKYMTDRETDEVSDFSQDSSYGILSSPRLKYEINTKSDAKIIIASDDRNRTAKTQASDKSSKVDQERSPSMEQNTLTPTQSPFPKGYNPFFLQSVKYSGSPACGSDISRFLRNEVQSTPSYRRVVKRPKKHTRSRTLNGLNACSMS